MKKVLLLFAVLMASVNLAYTEQATGINKCSDGKLTPFAAILEKGTDTGTIAGPDGMCQLMALSGIQPTSNHC